MGRFFITTPIYYVNDVPHIGHAYTTAAADVAARFHRQLGDDVFFLTGTDEHGTKVEQAAAARGLTPKQHVDEVVQKFKDVARKVGASNDFFIRTTDPEHEEFVQQFVAALPRRRRHLQELVLGALLPGLRGLLHRGEPGRRAVPRPRHRSRCTWKRTTTSSGSRPSRTGWPLTTRAIPISSVRAIATTRRSRSSSRVWTTSPSRALPSSGASACPGTIPRSSTCGWMHSSTT